MDDQLPDLSPLIEFIKKAGMLGLSVVLAVASIAFIYLIARIGYKIWNSTGEGDEDTKSKAIKNLIWAIIGFILITSASTIAGIFAAIFIAA